MISPWSLPTLPPLRASVGSGVAFARTSGLRFGTVGGGGDNGQHVRRSYTKKYNRRRIVCIIYYSIEFLERLLNIIHVYMYDWLISVSRSLKKKKSPP